MNQTEIDSLRCSSEFRELVGLVGAELNLLVERIRIVQGLTDQTSLPYERFFRVKGQYYLADVPVKRFESNVKKQLAKVEATSPTRMSDPLAPTLSLILRDMLTSVEALNARTTTMEDCVQSLLSAHQCLCASTVFRTLPQAGRQLNLSYIEFNSDFSGLPSSLIKELQQLDSGLLVNPALQVPQEGFSRIMTDKEVEHLFQTAGCRVFVLKSQEEMIGYYMFLPAPTQAIFPGKNLISVLVQKGLIDESCVSKIGFSRSLAVKKQHRLQFARAGINACSLLDDTMADTAQNEGCDVLVATVRVGENSNTSVKSHERCGWTRTGIIVDGCLEILIRHLAPREGLSSRSDDYVEARKREPATQENQLNGTPPTDPGLLSAPLIDAFIVEGRSKAEAEKILGGEADVSISYDGSSLQVTITRGRHVFALKQLRPTFDCWSISDSSGVWSLEESLGYLREWTERRH